MAIINNYGTLKAGLARYMFHQRFAPDYDTATANFENAANRRLRVRPMETSTPLTTVGGSVALPADYLVWRTVKDATRPGSDELEYVHPAYLPPSSFNRLPPVFTIEGNQFITSPVNDAVNTWDFHYYQKIPTIIAADASTNWLMDAGSDAYLFGVLTELFALGRNTEAAQLYKARRDEVFAEIIQLSALTTGATSPVARTAEYF